MNSFFFHCVTLVTTNLSRPSRIDLCRTVIERIDQSEFEGFEYVNPLLMSLEDCVWMSLDWFTLKLTYHLLAIALWECLQSKYLKKINDSIKSRWIHPLSGPENRLYRTSGNSFLLLERSADNQTHLFICRFSPWFMSNFVLTFQGNLQGFVQGLESFFISSKSGNEEIRTSWDLVVSVYVPVGSCQTRSNVCDDLSQKAVQEQNLKRKAWFCLLLPLLFVCIV